jgi:UDP-N-acetylglucosamine acyltransferase
VARAAGLKLRFKRVRESGMIHPSAIVAAGARLGAGVEVGPFAVIEAGAEVGDRCVIGAHAVLTRWVRMGAANRVGTGAVLGGDPQDLKFDFATESFVRVGEGNQFREHCTVHRASVPQGETVVGNGCLFMAGAHVGHDARVGDGTILANGSMLGGFTELGERVFVSGGVGIHQFVRIGRLAMTQGNSVITQNVLPFTMVAGVNRTAGLNVVGMRRAGFGAVERAEIRRAFKLLFTSGCNVPQALERAAQMAWSERAMEFWEFARGCSKRGICRWSGKRGGGAELEEAAG